MKALFCARCGDIRAFETWYTACRCGNMEAMWLDPVKGTVRVRARKRDYARIIGLNNAVLGRVQALAADPRFLDFTDAKWREIHTEAVEAPGYLFDKSRRACWAIVIGIGSSSDVSWDPLQEEYDAGTAPFNPTVSAEGRLRALKGIYKDARTLEELQKRIDAIVE